jgi:G:T/U-mismatch repair DNA glycosylase
VLNKHIADLQQMRLTRLPSTSPAHATLSFVQKRDQWQELLESKLVLRCCNNSILSA